jgi:hypothetical protein
MTTSEKRSQLISSVTSVLAIIAVLAAFGFIIAQAYVRWSLNQNFTFLGGNVIEALLIAGFGTLAYLRGRN